MQIAEQIHGALSGDNLPAPALSSDWQSSDTACWSEEIDGIAQISLFYVFEWSERKWPCYSSGMRYVFTRRSWNWMTLLSQYW
jgi:hypothetical protein